MKRGWLHNFAPLLLPGLLAFPSQGLAIDEETRTLYETLVEANADARNEALEKQILLLDAQGAATEETASAGLDLDEKRHRESALRLLETLSKNPDPAIAANALLRRAQLERKREPDDALKHVVAAAEIVSRVPESTIPHRADIHLLAGEILLKKGKRTEARAHFSEAARTSTLSEERMRAHIGMADAAFADYDFEDAQARLRDARALFQKAPAGERKRLESFETPLLIRCIWAYFRGGKYNETLASMDDYFRERARTGVKVSEAVEADLIRSGGASLYEKNDPSAFERLATQPLAGALGRRMILSAFEAYIRAGRADEVEPLGLRVESAYPTTPEYPEFLALRRKAAENAGNVVLRYDLSARIATELGSTSVWRRTVTPDQEQDASRGRLVIEASEEAGAHFYEAGLRSRRVSDFARSEMAYATRLEEHSPGENRGALHLRAAQSALMAEHGDSAIKQARSALENPLDPADRKAALHVLVLAARQRVNASSQTKDQEFLEYISAVDLYFRENPSDASARSAQLESARVAALMGALPMAISRSEQLLAHLSPHEPSGELAIVVEFLLRLHAENPDTRESSKALEDLERRLRHRAAPEALQALAAAANASGVRRDAARLRSEGQLEGAVRRLISWAEQNPENGEAPFVALDGARSAFEIGKWSDSLSACDFIEKNYPRHQLLWEASYWRGRALEANLSFLSAAGSYVKSAQDDASRLPSELRIDALKRARDLFRELGDRAWEGTTAEKLGDLHAALHRRAEAAQARLQAARAFLLAGEHRRAEGLFARARSERSLPHADKFDAELGELEARLADGKRNRQARQALEIFARRLATQKKSAPPQDEASRKARFEALRLILAENTDEARRLRCVAFGALDAKACGRLGELASASRRVVARNAGGLETLEQARLTLEAEEIRLLWCEETQKAAYIATDLAHTKRDVMMETAERNRVEARQKISLASSGIPSGHELRLRARQLLVRNVPLAEGGIPQPSAVADSDDTRSHLARQMFSHAKGSTP